MRLFDNLYRSVSGVTLWTAEFFNAIFRSLDDRVHKLEVRDLTVDGIIGDIRSQSQKIIQDVFDPAVLTIQRMQEAGFLIASSATSHRLVEGEDFTFVIDEGDSRNLFTPSIFTIATRASTPDDYAVLRTIRYDRPSGAYAFEVVSITGAPGPHSDWIVGALAGATIAQLDYLARGVVVRDVTLEAREGLEELTATATRAAATASEQRSAAQGYALATSNARRDAVDAAGRAEAARDQLEGQLDPPRWDEIEETPTTLDGYGITDAKRSRFETVFVNGSRALTKDDVGKFLSCTGGAVVLTLPGGVMQAGDEILFAVMSANTTVTIQSAGMNVYSQGDRNKVYDRGFTVLRCTGPYAYMGQDVRQIHEAMVSVGLLPAAPVNRAGDRMAGALSSAVVDHGTKGSVTETFDYVGGNTHSVTVAGSLTISPTGMSEGDVLQINVSFSSGSIAVAGTTYWELGGGEKSTSLADLGIALTSGTTGARYRIVFEMVGGRRMGVFQ